MRGITLALGFALLPALVLAQPQPGSPWPMLHHDAQHTSRSTVAAYPWAFPTSVLVSSAPVGSPAMGSDGTIYFGTTGGDFYAIGPDQQVKWTYHEPASIRTSPVIAADGTIYYGLNNGYVSALTPQGALKWQFMPPYKAPGTAAIGNDGTVYLGAARGICAVWPDGTQRWFYPQSTGGFGTPTIAADGTIYTVNSSNVMYAFDAAGNVLWTTAGKAPVKGPVALGYDGTIYGVSGQGICAYSPSGEPLWTATLSAVPASTLSIAPDGTLRYVGVADTQLCIAAADASGNLLWYAKNASNDYFAELGTPERCLAIGSDGSAIGCGGWTSADGRMLAGGRAFATDPVLTADETVIGLDEGTAPLVVISKPSGREDWRVAFTSTVSRPQLVSDGTTYATDANGVFLAITPDGLPFGAGSPGLFYSYRATDDALYFSNTSSRLAKTLRDGAPLWDAPDTPGATHIYVGPAGHVYTATGSKLRAHGPDGATLWTASYSMNSDIERVVVDSDGGAWFSGNVAYLYRFDPTGAVTWSVRIPSAGGPAVDGSGVAYVGSSDGLYAINPDGTTKWLCPNTPITSDITIGPDGTLYGAGNGVVAAVSPDGTCQWQTAILGDSGAVAHDAQGRLYVWSGGFVYCLSSGGQLLAAYPSAIPPNTYYGPTQVLPDGRSVHAVNLNVVCNEFWARTVTGTTVFWDMAVPPVATQIDMRAAGSTQSLGAPMVAIAADGTFLLRAPAANMDLAIKPPHHLRKVIDGVDTTTADVSGVTAEFVNGDANEDNRIDLLDLSTVLSNFGAHGTAADLDGSGLVDLLDLSVVLSNFGMVGDQ